MIIFYADAGWELDLTGTKITLVEENDLFHDYFVKDYSLPFLINIEKFSDDQIRFLHLDNVSLATAHYPGKIYIDNKFKNGYLSVKSVQGKSVKGIIYYGKTTIPLLETKLADLPFPIIDNLQVEALAAISKSYPDVGFNFPMIIDEEFKSNTNYENFEGIINQHDGSAFIGNNIVSLEIFNRNVLTPFPYIMEILRVGIESAGLLLNGDFINDKVNEKLILDTSKFLQRFSASSQDSHIFSAATNEFIFDNEILTEWKKTFSAFIVGTYKLKMLLNLPSSVLIYSFKVFHKNIEIYSNASNVINEEISINVSDNTMFGDVDIELRTYQNEIDITDYNKFEFESSADKLNIFSDSFSLSEVMPDMTFGAFLNKLKIWFKLKLVITENVLRLDYISNKLVETQFADKTKYEIKKPLKEPSSIKIYKLQYTENDFIYVDVNGQTFTPEYYGNNEMAPIDIGIKVLPIEELGGVFTAKRNEDDPDFKILLYDGLQSGLPVTVETVQGRNFKLPEIYELYYKRWFLFLLNAITFVDKFECDASEEWDVNEGQYKYNQKLIFTKISKTRKTEDTWDVSCISKSLL